MKKVKTWNDDSSKNDQKNMCKQNAVSKFMGNFVDR